MQWSFHFYFCSLPKEILKLSQSEYIRFFYTCWTFSKVPLPIMCHVPASRISNSSIPITCISNNRKSNLLLEFMTNNETSHIVCFVQLSNKWLFHQEHDTTYNAYKNSWFRVMFLFSIYGTDWMSHPDYLLHLARIIIAACLRPWAIVICW